MTCTGMLVLSGFRPRCLNIVSAAPYRVEQILANNARTRIRIASAQRAHLQVRHPLRFRVSNRDRGVGAEARYRGLTEVSEGERDMGGPHADAWPNWPSPFIYAGVVLLAWLT